MRRFAEITLLLAAVLSTAAFAQKTVLVDSDGHRLTDREFVDIRMANYQWTDQTIRTVLADGTIELRTQKIAQEGMTAPAAILKTIDGKEIDLSSLRGKVVVLNFWFIGCPACIAERESLNALRAKFSTEPNAVFLAVTYETAKDVKRYLAKQPLDYIQTTDADAAIKLFAFNGFPKNVVISKTGEIVYWRSTVHAWDKFEDVIRDELVK